MISGSSSQRSGSNTASTALRRAVSHVSSLWFPINAPLLERIQVALREGKYDLDLDFLIEDLKSDLALFTYTIKQLCELVEKESGGSKLGELSVRELFEFCGIVKIQQVLAVAPNQISRHASDSSSQSQVETIEAALISASTAELLAEKQGADLVDTFSTAVLRQLGLTLIAYNYPTAFRKAISMSGNGKGLDLVISEQLGFSPALLASALVQQWRPLSRTIRYAVAQERGLNPEELDRVSAIKNDAETIKKVCEVGEALVRASAPSRYPSASQDWQSARDFIEATLGHEGMHQIAERVKTSCTGYAKLFPGMLPRGENFNPEHALHEHHYAAVVAQNPLIAQCLPPLRVALAELYSKLESKITTKDALQFLVSRVLPVSGFVGGCVFTLDPAISALVPRLKFGRVELRKVNSVAISENGSNGDCVALAFNCAAPILEHYQTDPETEIGLVAGAFGGSKSIGVLYVEYPYAVLKELSSGALTHFKAIKSALNHCLDLR